MADRVAKSAQSLRAIEQKHAALVKRAQAFASSKSTLAIEANASLERVSCSFQQRLPCAASLTLAQTVRSVSCDSNG